ncbi:13S globulin basic chain-like [Oryza glaberrima]|uniref:13S globulin basic chain-like n=1 Tax=Oryza glaberrima TaxID=4538 RepID=UPI00224BF2E2|nr:13S globulin basic chain-like [Oryza glaberrima]
MSAKEKGQIALVRGSRFWEDLFSRTARRLPRRERELQVVSSEGRRVFDGELWHEQMVVVPQSFAVAGRAGDEGFAWVSFQTSDDAMNAPVVGKSSALRHHDHVNLILSPAAASARCRPPPLLASTSTSSTVSWCAIAS